MEAGFYSELNCPAVKIVDYCNSFFQFLVKLRWTNSRHGVEEVEQKSLEKIMS